MADFYYEKQFVTSFLTKEKRYFRPEYIITKSNFEMFKKLTVILAKYLYFPQKLLNLLFLNWAVRPIWKSNLRIRFRLPHYNKHFDVRTTEIGLVDAGLHSNGRGCFNPIFF